MIQLPFLEQPCDVIFFVLCFEFGLQEAENYNCYCCIGIYIYAIIVIIVEPEVDAKCYFQDFHTHKSLYVY